MKSVVLIAGCTALFALMQGCSNPATIATEQQRTKVVWPAVTDSAAVSQTVLSFLGWYKTNLGKISQIQLVNQPEGKPYSVNLDNSERYFDYDLVMFKQDVDSQLDSLNALTIQTVTVDPLYNLFYWTRTNFGSFGLVSDE